MRRRPLRWRLQQKPRAKLALNCGQAYGDAVGSGGAHSSSNGGERSRPIANADRGTSRGNTQSAPETATRAAASRATVCGWAGKIRLEHHRENRRERERWLPVRDCEIPAFGHHSQRRPAQQRAPAPTPAALHARRPRGHRDAANGQACCGRPVQAQHTRSPGARIWAAARFRKRGRHATSRASRAGTAGVTRRTASNPAFVAWSNPSSHQPGKVRSAWFSSALPSMPLIYNESRAKAKFLARAQIRKSGKEFQILWRFPPLSYVRA